MARPVVRPIGSLVRRGKAGTYYLRYYLGDAGRRKQVWKSLGTADAKVAEQKAAEEQTLLALKDRQRQLLNLKGHLTATAEEQVALEKTQEQAKVPPLAVAEAWPEFVASASRPPCGPVTLRDYAQRWRKFASWWADNRRNRPLMQDVGVGDAEAFARWLNQQQLSPNRYNKCVQTARLVFHVLARLCDDKPNPFGDTGRRGIRNKPLKTVNKRALSDGELELLLKTATGELRLLLLVGIRTGLRLGDAATLRWEEIDLRRHPHGTGLISRVPNKTRNRKPDQAVIIPLHESLHRVLEAVPVRKRRGFVLPKMADTYLRNRNVVTRWITQLLETCEIDTSNAGFHSLRHFFVSSAAAAGVPPAVIQAIVGHGSPLMTRVYMHLDTNTIAPAVMTQPALDAGTAPKLLPPAAPAAGRSAEQKLDLIVARVRDAKGKLADAIREIVAS